MAESIRGRGVETLIVPELFFIADAPFPYKNKSVLWRTVRRQAKGPLCSCGILAYQIPFPAIH
jgi:hypothetical protein